MYPFFLQNILLPIADKIGRQGFLGELKLLRKQVMMTESELNFLQKQKLANLLQHASTNSPFYNKIFKFNPNHDPFDTLKYLPVLEKKEIRMYTNEMLTSDKSTLLKNSSSGSSGYQTTVYWSHKEQAINRATQMLWWEWAGYRIGDPLLQTGITPQRGWTKGLKDKLFNTYYLQAFTHTKEDVIKALQWAKKQKNPVLAGYASSLFVIAKYALEENIKVDFKAAVCWGDKLFDHYRKTIYLAFEVDICETYGSAEGLMLGGQKDMEYMYLMSSNVYVEILDEQGNEVKDGELGNVIVTNLNGYAMPLIRYRIGDLAIKLPANKYPDERQYKLPLWQKIIGRDTDLVETASGKYLVVHSFTGIFEHIPEIKQFCVIQDSKKGITIQYIKGANFSSSVLEQAKNKILSYINEPFEIIFEEVFFIAPTKSGKPQLIISKLNLQKYE
jgi:phenylacetate-CoA ligase